MKAYSSAERDLVRAILWGKPVYLILAVLGSLVMTFFAYGSWSSLYIEYGHPYSIVEGNLMILSLLFLWVIVSSALIRMKRYLQSSREESGASKR